MYSVHTNPIFSLEQERKANEATKVYDNPLSSMMKDLPDDSIPYISTYSQVSDNEFTSQESEESEEKEEFSLTDGSSSDISTAKTESSVEKSKIEDEQIPEIHMADEPEPEVEHLDKEGEASTTFRPQKTDFPKAKGVQICTIDNIPAEQWEAKCQEFHAWMIVHNLTEESHFEILSVFTAHFAGILKDWWTSLGD